MLGQLLEVVMAISGHPLTSTALSFEPVLQDRIITFPPFRTSLTTPAPINQPA